MMIKLKRMKDIRRHGDTMQRRVIRNLKIIIIYVESILLFFQKGAIFKNEIYVSLKIMAQ